MRPLRFLILVVIAFLLIGQPSPAFAAWVWSPQTGWVGKGGAVKDTPEEQLAFATALFGQRDYDGALREFKKLVKRYKNSKEAAEAQYYVGRCEEERGDYYKAFLAYRKTIQVYPSTQRFEEILEREYQIGNYFLSGKKRKLWGTAALVPARDKSIEVFQAITEDGPFSKYGELAQYKLGLAHMALAEYEQAVTAFEQLISRYSDSALVDDARFQIAQASLKGVFEPSYDQSPTDLAVRELEAFVREYPESELSGEAAGRLQTLTSRRAHHDYLVAQFYEQRHRPDSALIYYDWIAEQFPETPWASRAAARAEVLRRQSSS